MKKIWFLLFGILSLSYFLVYKGKIQSEKSSHIRYTAGPHFYSMSITKCPRSNLPSISIEIEGKKKDFLIDLGFNGHICVSDNFLRQIEDKRFLTKSKIHNFRGIAHERNVYQIPKIEIGELTFHNLEVEEMDIKQHLDTTFPEENSEASSMEDGRFGWKIFENVNLFLDFHNSIFAFCDSLDTLKKEGYPVEAFIKIPMITEREMIELKVNTENGLFTCLLDTGSTLNILNKESKNGLPIEQAIWMPENKITLSQFQISKNDFGPISFVRLPLNLKTKIDAILGMQFFDTHMIFLDFEEKYIYLAKTSTTQASLRRC